LQSAETGGVERLLGQLAIQGASANAGIAPVGNTSTFSGGQR
jgi:hypothetical protein